jgi:GNAT superfamily N-acetyltransferase
MNAPTQFGVEEHRKDDLLISTDHARLDLSVIHGFLVNCYWCKGIPREIVMRSIEHSLCFGIYQGEQQVGFARVISDYATYAYIGDVFVLESHRARGLAKWLMQCIVEHPQLQGLRRWSLVTADAHSLYSPVGFEPLAATERWMEIFNRDVYAKTLK